MKIMQAIYIFPSTTINRKKINLFIKQKHEEAQKMDANKNSEKKVALSNYKICLKKINPFFDHLV